ncbi:MAG TPA: hypothetical protein VLB84_03610 [Bacteroidia bacterium]|nr:hypothetical protein [Bacteroidia bacterium]
MLGIVIAGTFFVLQLDNYFKELNFHKNFVKTFMDHLSEENKKEKIKQNIPAKITNKKEMEQPSSKTELQKKEKLTTDTLIYPDSTAKRYNFSDNIVIRKDELLNIRKMELFNLTPPVIKTHQDSLLEKVSDIKEKKVNSGKQYMQIEFWKSPLNYKGYKLSKYNVILYGLSDTQNLKIFTLDDVFYMKHASVIYKLDYNTDFKPYERVLDENILHNFK